MKNWKLILVWSKIIWTLRKYFSFGPKLFWTFRRIGHLDHWIFISDTKVIKINKKFDIRRYLHSMPIYIIFHFYPIFQVVVFILTLQCAFGLPDPGKAGKQCTLVRSPTDTGKDLWIRGLLLSIHVVFYGQFLGQIFSSI